MWIAQYRRREGRGGDFEGRLLRLHRTSWRTDPVICSRLRRHFAATWRNLLCAKFASDKCMRRVGRAPIRKDVEGRPPSWRDRWSHGDDDSIGGGSGSSSAHREAWRWPNLGVHSVHIVGKAHQPIATHRSLAEKCHLRRHHRCRRRPCHHWWLRLDPSSWRSTLSPSYREVNFSFLLRRC